MCDISRLRCHHVWIICLLVFLWVRLRKLYDHILLTFGAALRASVLSRRSIASAAFWRAQEQQISRLHLTKLIDVCDQCIIPSLVKTLARLWTIALRSATDGRIPVLCIILVETLALMDLHTTRELILQMRDSHKIATAGRGCEKRHWRYHQP